MNCRKVNSLLSAYMDGELPGVEQLQIREHLRECPCCYEDHESLLVTKRLLSGLCMRQPRPELENQILTCLSGEDRQSIGAGLFGVNDWWLLLTHRQRLNHAAVFATTAVVILLLVVTPYAAHDARNGTTVAMRTSPITEAGTQAPPREALIYHDAMNTIPTMDRRSPLTPVSLDSPGAPVH